MTKKIKRKIPMIVKHCEWCGKAYNPAPNAKNPKYDSPTCKQAAWRERQRQRKLQAIVTPTIDELNLWGGIQRYCGGYQEAHDAISKIWKNAPMAERFDALNSIRILVQLAVEHNERVKSEALQAH